MVDVVDRVATQRKNLRQPAADLVDQEHQPQRRIAIEPRLSGGRHRHGIEIVVAEFPGGAAAGGVVAKVRAVGIPLPHSRGIRRDRFFYSYRPAGPKTDRPT